MRTREIPFKMPMKNVKIKNNLRKIIFLLSEDHLRACRFSLRGKQEDEMKIRHKTATILLLLLCLVPIACKRVEKEDTRAETEERGQTKKKDKEEQRGEKEEKAEEAMLRDLPHILFEVEGETHSDSDYHYLYQIESTKLKLKEGQKFKALDKAFEEYNKEVDELYQKERTELENSSHSSEEAKKNVLSSSGNTPEFKMNCELIRADKAIVSVLLLKSTDYTGSGMEYSRSAVNFDTRSGKRLSFSDVVKDADSFFMLAEKRAKESVGTDTEFPPELLDKIKEKGSELTWTVNQEGVSVYLDIYEYGKSRREPAVLTVYFDEARNVFEERYTKTEEDYVIPLIGDMHLDLDIDGDGKREAVYLKKKSEDANSAYLDFSAVASGRESEALEGFDGRAYIVKKSGKYYMYVFVSAEDDITLLYRLDLSTMEKKEGEYWATDLSTKYYTWRNEGNIETHRYEEENFSDAAGFCGSGRNDVLSTNSVEIDWVLDKEAYPRPDGNRYRVTSNHVLRTLKDIPAPEVDAKGNVVKESVIPANSYLLFLYSDNESFVDMRIIEEKYVDKENWGGDSSYFNLNDSGQFDYNGPLYRIRMERDTENWITKVNGVDAEELFEGMAYAG